MMDTLKRIMSLCKCGVYLTVNQHRDYYESVASYMDHVNGGHPVPADELHPEVLAEMIRTDTIVQVQCYNETPTSFYAVFHHDLDAALSQMLKKLESR